MQSGMSRRKFQALGSSGEVRKFFSKQLKGQQKSGKFFNIFCGKFAEALFLEAY